MLNISLIRDGIVGCDAEGDRGHGVTIVNGAKFLHFKTTLCVSNIHQNSK